MYCDSRKFRPLSSPPAANCWCDSRPPASIRSIPSSARAALISRAHARHPRLRRRRHSGSDRRGGAGLPAGRCSVFLQRRHRRPPRHVCRIRGDRRAAGRAHTASHLAKLHGVRVATTISGADKKRFVTELGAELVIDYRQAKFVDAVLKWTGGRGADVAFDTIGGSTFIRTTHAVRYRGDLVTLLQPGPDMDWKEARLRNLRVSFELMLSPYTIGLFDAQQHQADILRRCGPLLDAGALRVHVAQTLPLEQAGAAHRLLEGGGMTGKLDLTIDE